eukprot:522334-Amphidinium_carterae.1
MHIWEAADRMKDCKCNGHTLEAEVRMRQSFGIHPSENDWQGSAPRHIPQHASMLPDTQHITDVQIHGSSSFDAILPR